MSIRRYLRIILFGFLALSACDLYADWKTEIGWTQLASEVGPGLEDGSGIAVAMAETAVNNNYLPSLGNAEFTGKNIIAGSGASGTSNHATGMAQTFFGNNISIAPGITQITVFSATDWINNVTGLATGGDPLPHPYRVMNNSWIASSNDPATIISLSQRADFIAVQNQMTMVAGTNNGSANPLPPILTAPYNTIVVGRTDGNHAAGSTAAYGPGRTRPDIVAPGRLNVGGNTSTSRATAMVSSAAAVLHHKAQGTGADRIDVIRAVILAGATKDDVPNWDRTVSRPLDDRYGAGELNIYNSYRIMDAGQFSGSIDEPAASVGSHGWDYQTNLNAGGARFYDFQIAPGTRWADFSIILTWNMLITDTNPSSSIFSPTELLGNLDLDLFDSSGAFLGSVVDSSLATIGNIEHLYFAQLGAGRYTLRVSSDTSRDYALAWRANVLAIPEPASVVWGGIMMLSLIATRRRSI